MFTFSKSEICFPRLLTNIEPIGIEQWIRQRMILPSHYVSGRMNHVVKREPGLLYLYVVLICTCMRRGLNNYASRSGCFREVVKESVKKDAPLHHLFYDLEEVFYGEGKLNSMVDHCCSETIVKSKEQKGGRRAKMKEEWGWLP